MKGDRTEEYSWPTVDRKKRPQSIERENRGETLHRHARLTCVGRPPFCKHRLNCSEVWANAGAAPAPGPNFWRGAKSGIGCRRRRRLGSLSHRATADVVQANGHQHRAANTDTGTMAQATAREGCRPAGRRSTHVWTERLAQNALPCGSVVHTTIEIRDLWVARALRSHKAVA